MLRNSYDLVKISDDIGVDYGKPPLSLVENENFTNFVSQLILKKFKTTLIRK